MSKERTWSMPLLRREAAREDRAARRPRLHQPDRVPDRGLDGGEAAARGHHQERRVDPRILDALPQVLQVAGHERLHVGVRARGGEALVLADLRTYVGGKGEPRIGEGFAQALRDLLLVRGVGIAVHEPDGDALHLFPREALDCRVDRRGVGGAAAPAPPRPRARAPGPAGSEARAAPASARGCRTARSGSRRPSPPNRGSLPSPPARSSRPFAR